MNTLLEFVLNVRPRPRFLVRVPRPGRREKKDAGRVGYTFLKAERVTYICVYIEPEELKVERRNPGGEGGV